MVLADTFDNAELWMLSLETAPIEGKEILAADIVDLGTEGMTEARLVTIDGAVLHSFIIHATADRPMYRSD